MVAIIEKCSFQPLHSEWVRKIEFDFTKAKLQRAKFRRLSKLVSRLFEGSLSRKEVSNKIIVFLNITSENPMFDIFSQIKDTPYSHAGPGIQEILRREFL